MSISLLRRLLMKEAVKDTAGSSGIMSINKGITEKVEKQLQKYVSDAMQQGVDLDTLSPEQLKMIVQINKPKPPRVIPADSPEGRQITEQLFGKRGEVVDFPQKRSFKQEVDDMIKDGTITKGPRGMKKSKKVTDREMFKAANERLMSDVDSIIKNIKSMEPITAMKEANSVIARKGKYKNLTPEQSKKILQDTEDHIFERDIPETEDFAAGGIARANFFGGGMGRRGFLKMLAGLGGGIAAAKTGILKLAGKEPVKQVAKETVKQSAGSPPPYFLNLVKKIKTLGDDVTEKAATTEREVVTEFKDYRLTEDVDTGRKTIQKTKLDTNEQYYDETLAEQTYMDYIPGKGQADETTGKVADEYIEDTSYLRTSGPQKGEVLDVVDGVPEDVIKEGTIFEDNMTEFGKIKKASGGIARMLGE